MGSREIPRITHLYHEIKPGGGPAGYLSHLKQAAALYGTESDYRIEASTAVALPANPKAKLIKLIRRLRTDVFPKIHPMRTERVRRRQGVKVLTDWLETTYSWLTPADVERLFAADLVVAHSTLLAERMVRLCPQQASRKLVLMTHSPTFLTHELVSAAAPTTPEEELYSEPFVQDMVAREMHTMQSVRAVLWPCEQSQEGYPEWWKFYQSGEARNVYAETGVARPIPQTPVEALRRAWEIAPHQRIALFIGRPHPHKGFDRFVDWADLNRKRGDSSWVFVHCGNASSSRRDLSSVRLAGYVSDNGAAYLAADLVLIPNKYSYFDLGVIEALSLGARLAISPTGGHAYLINTYPIIPSIPNGREEEAWDRLETIADEYAADPGRQQQIRALGEQHFSLRPFFANHTAIAAQLLQTTR